jgi:DNA-binding transcriptional MerR regulator
VRIGELAARSGVSIRALRYYEEQGLLVAARSPSGQRHYPEPAVDRVGVIQLLYAAGLPSRTIEPLLWCLDASDEPARWVALASLTVHQEQLDDRITGLLRARDALDDIVRAVSQCSARPSPVAREVP